ncbi:MAG: corrinoid protein [Spirochaetales bacterium]|nr:corrinoid protein [Spirochaetales bacterium]
MSEKLIKAISELKEQEAVALVSQLLEKGESPSVLLDSIRKAMEIVGRRFEKNEYFLPELIMSGEIMNKVKNVLECAQVGEQSKSYRGKVVLGTVKGDIHNIGKDIVAFMLDTNGYEVIDLGVDVSADTFVEAVREHKPQVLGLSALLTPAFDAMKNTVNAITENGLRNDLKVMIGGGQMNADVCRYTGADDYGTNAMDAIGLVKNWIGG